MRVAALLAVAFILSGCAIGGKTTTTTVTRTVTTQAKPGPLAQTSNARYFGTPVAPVSQLDAKRYALTIKPQFFLVGVTANVVNAAQQGNACAPLECPGVDDDHVVIPAGSQNLLFILPATMKGTVITAGKHAMKNTVVTAAQLAAIIGGAKTPKLIEGLASGLWLTVDGDTVTSFAQQFAP